MFIKKSTFLFLALFCACSSNAMDKEQLGKIVIAQKCVHKKQIPNKPTLTYDASHYLTTENVSECDQCMTIPESTVLTKEDVSKKNVSWFSSLPSISIPGASHVKNAFASLGSLLSRSNVSTPKDWEREWHFPWDGTWNTQDTVSSTLNKNYAVLRLIPIKPEDKESQAFIYDINEQRMLAYKKLPEDEKFVYNKISRDGTCYALVTTKREDENSEATTYLYNIAQGDKPKVVTYQRAQFINIKDNNMLCVIERGTHLEIHDMKSGKEHKIDLKDLTHIEPLATSTRETRYILLQTAQGNVFIADIEKEYALTKIPYKESFKIPDRLFNAPPGYVIALVDGNVCVYNVELGTTIFEQPYNGSNDIKDIYWSNSRNADFCTFVADEKMYLCNFPAKKLILMNIDYPTWSNYTSFNTQQTCFFLREESQKEPVVYRFYNTDGELVHRQELSTRDLSSVWGWLNNDWMFLYFYDKPTIAHFLHPQTRELKSIECANSIGSMKRRGFECILSKDRKSIIVCYPEDKEIKYVSILSPNNEELGGGLLNDDGSYLVFWTRNKAKSYVCDRKTGRILKEFKHDENDPIQKWEFNSKNDYGVMINTWTMDVIDKDFNIVQSFKYRSPLLSLYSRFDHYGMLFRVRTQDKGLYYYIINKDGVKEVL